MPQHEISCVNTIKRRMLVILEVTGIRTQYPVTGVQSEFRYATKIVPSNCPPAREG
jgi:hypothetical protein